MSKKTGLKRTGNDKFYTSAHVVRQCVDAWRQHLSIDPVDICIEPSAGDGAFIPSIRETVRHATFYDIEPEHPDILQQDFLMVDTPTKQTPTQRIHVLGNPPFGRQSTLLIRFIKKCAAFADTISFIMPKSFKKDSMQRHFPPHFHLECDIALPEDAFYMGETVLRVPCVFQIWVRKETPRARTAKQEPVGYAFVRKEDQPDISIRRVGIQCGRMDTEIADKSIQSHYFLRFDKPLTKTLRKKLFSTTFPTMDFTVGPRSISKQDIIQQINAYFI